MKVREYKVITGNPKDVFEKKMKEALADGWQPLGGVSTAVISIKIGGEETIGITFSQAVGHGE